MILHAVEAGPDQPPPGSSVVLLHGLFGSARNFGLVQRRLAVAHRVIALDLRNHGASPHAASMDYAEIATDVIETLAARDALPAVLIGHSMGGKAAMRVALDRPDAVTALLVADIAPVPYPPHFQAIAEAMAAVPRRPGLTRAAADAALAETEPDPALRGFLLQNFVPGAGADEVPHWRIGLAEIIAALPMIGGWKAPDGARYPGPVLVVSGAQSDYVRPEHRAVFRALFPAARFVSLRHAGHWLHADNPAGFVAVAEAFLQAFGAATP
ncbi:MAG: alpha/beta fold hydrolase [Acetobacteraceae bacterium]